MSKSVVFYILLVAIIAILFAAFQYLYKNKSNGKNKYVLFVLRFISFFSLLLLLINPKFTKQILTNVKPKLVILVDDSNSIQKIKQSTLVKKTRDKIKKNKDLKDKFQLDFYTFSDDVIQNDTLRFIKNNTNIQQSLKSVNALYKKAIAPIILLSDGNQTIGIDYVNFKSKQTIYPIVFGDTVTYQDLKITQINVNKYAYLRHRFPVEAFVLYDGNGKNINAKFKVVKNGKVVFTKNMVLKDKNDAKQVAFYLPANQVGIHQYKASVTYLENEKNKINNQHNFAIEVIDEQSKIVLVSDIIHPDLGMLKKAIESNKQRKISIKKPTDNFSLGEYQLVILYQPNLKFKTIFSKLERTNKNFLLFTGSKTDWNFLNKSQKYFSKKVINKTEDYLANYNPSYATFQTEDIGFNNFAPVIDFFGDVTFSIPYNTLLQQQIGNFPSQAPLLATFEHNNRRGAVFLGENSWRWRMLSNVEKKSFQAYDSYMNKLIQYLSSNKRSKLIEVISKKPFYYANETVKIVVQAYDANYAFDANAKLWITLTHTKTKKQKKYPFALQNNSFEVKIAELKTGNYQYKIVNELHKNEAHGKFTILNYNMEQQAINANKKSLSQLAINNGGKVFYPNQIEELITELAQDKKYITIQKSKEKITPLIDWKWLLGIIALALSAEWFIRKYKGYI